MDRNMISPRVACFVMFVAASVAMSASFPASVSVSPAASATAVAVRRASPIWLESSMATVIPVSKSCYMRTTSIA
jgi:hypothetical protein